jgi:cellulose synthase/poly-beta-1,6-N-acetylglucosamine synthase-like glycosyltransferase
MKSYMLVVLVFFGVFAVVHAVLLVLAAVEIRRYWGRLVESSLRRTVRSPLAPGISVVVPAYNEAAGIIDSVRSLLALEYPRFEVVVVNDGSLDETLESLVKAFDLVQAQRPTPPFLPHQRVRGVYAPRAQLSLLVLDKENGGKADALNAGINFARHPLVCAIDADSMLEQDALVKTATPFVDDPDRTIVSGGLVRIANGCRIDLGRVVEARLPRTVLPMFQVIDYLRGFFGARPGWSAINSLLIVSGAFGLFRRDAVIAAGGYRADTVGEDIELITRLHRAMHELRRPYRITYVPDPVCWTEAPETARVLRRQRRRWQRGSIETLLLHRRMLSNPRYRGVGLAALPSLLLFEILGPLIELSGYVVAIVAWATGAVDWHVFALFLAIAVLYGLILSLGAIALEDATFSRHPGWDKLGRILVFAVLETLGFRQLVLLWRLQGYWPVFRPGGWGPMDRRGFAGAGRAPL